MNWLFVFIGGGAGSILRYGISFLVQRQTTVTFPLATLFSNIISCLLFAAVYFVYQQKDLIPQSMRVLLITGFCGGLSTFSAFSFETFELIRRGELLYAVLNVLVSVLLCLGIFYALAAKGN